MQEVSTPRTLHPPPPSLNPLPYCCRPPSTPHERLQLLLADCCHPESRVRTLALCCSTPLHTISARTRRKAIAAFKLLLSQIKGSDACFVLYVVHSVGCCQTVVIPKSRVRTLNSLLLYVVHRFTYDIWTRTRPNSIPQLRRLFCVLSRYETLSATSDGYQMAFPASGFRLLRHLVSIDCECFASPLNCTLSR